MRLARICVCSSCARGGNDEAHHPSAQGKQSAKGVRATAAANSQSRMMVSRVTLWLNAAQVDTFGSADPYVCVSALDPSQTKVIHDHKAIEVEIPVKQPARRCCGAHAHRLQPGLSGAEFSQVSRLGRSRCSSCCSGGLIPERLL